MISIINSTFYFCFYLVHSVARGSSEGSHIYLFSEHIEQTNMMNDVNGLKMKGRKIPGATKERAFRLWLQGFSYRKIVDETGMSLGAINQLVEDARKRIPNLDELRELNVVLKNDGSSIYDAIRGGKLLEEMNELNVDLDELEGYNILAGRISSEKNVEAKNFVCSSMRFIGLEKQTGKTYEELVKDFVGFSSKIIEHKETIRQLKKKVKGLNQECSLIKETFSAQGLDWAEGLKLVKGVKDLRAEAELMSNSLDALRFDMEEEEKKLGNVKGTGIHLKSSIKTLKREVDALRRKYTFYSTWMQYEAPRIWRCQTDLEDLTNELRNKRIHEQTILKQLQEENRAMEERDALLEQRYVELSTTVKDLEARRGSLERECVNMVDAAKKRRDKLDAAGQRRLENAKEKAEEILKDGEAKRDRVLASVKGEREKLHKQVEILKAENALLKVAGEPILKQLREERKRLEEAEATAKKENLLPFPDTIRLPKIKSLNS